MSTNTIANTLRNMPHNMPDEQEALDEAFYGYWRLRTPKTKQDLLDSLETVGFENPSMADVERLTKKYSNIKYQLDNTPEPKPQKEGDEAVIERVYETKEPEKEAIEAAMRFNEAENSMYFSAVSYPAMLKLDKLNSPTAYRFYNKASLNVDMKTGRTKKMSRNDWIEYLGISRRGWDKLEKRMAEAELIEYHPDDVKVMRQKVHFFLPDVADWYNNVMQHQPHKIKDLV